MISCTIHVKYLTKANYVNDKKYMYTRLHMQLLPIICMINYTHQSKPYNVMPKVNFLT